MHRVFVEKQTEFNAEARSLFHDLKENLNLDSLQSVRVIQRYDVDGLTDEQFATATQLILSEPQIATVADELSIASDETAYAVEYLPGQYDQRADSAAQCVQILTQEAQPLVATAKVIILKGHVDAQQLADIKEFSINAVDSREASMAKPETLEMTTDTPADVAVLEGFINDNKDGLAIRRNDLGLAMSLEDLAFTQKYFHDEEDRDPTITEIKMLDTYWSDHCRHTTFATKIEKVDFDSGADLIKNAYVKYQETREDVYGDRIGTRPENLMDIALIGMKELRKTGELDNVEISEEINAASIVIPVDVDGVDQEWLLMFKNETHNHPTEIEPFGGAATCLGGCIRDPLSGRSYIFQAMRVTGAADPRTPFADTMPGKLPQRVICKEAAHGYSSYGNQIGLATGQVAEVYHPNYVAKRMEIGAVVAAAPKKNVFRGSPATGDVILLIGGRTGRDGVGGATGSSKEHTDTALENSAEVQKGNPPTERKIQRLFRDADLAPRIKVCNDFGAGGVSVAIGEIADSLDIRLDDIPKKYDGLDGTELAISESQERMAICVDPSEIDYFKAACDRENLECTHVADVTDTGRLVISFRDKKIVDFSRAFLETNGVVQSAHIHVTAPNPDTCPLASTRQNLTQPLYYGHERKLSQQSSCSDEQESSGNIGQAITEVLGKVYRASQKPSVPTPKTRAERLETNRAIRTIEEQQLRRSLESQIQDPADFLEKWEQCGQISGAEQKAYPDGNGNYIKANSGDYHGHWNEYIERLHLHQFLFPETAYELIGLTEIEQQIHFLVSQKEAYAFQNEKGDYMGASRSQVEAHMEKLGAYRFRNDDYYIPSQDILVEDLHDENVLLAEDGETLLFIDPVIFRRPADIPVPAAISGDSALTRFTTILSDLNSCGQKGLGEMFDSSIGAGTVLSPFGGKYQLTPTDSMVAKIPLLEGETTTCSYMSWGFNPNVASWSPYHGALYAVTESVCRIVSAGAHLSDIRLTLQEYFEKLGKDPSRWGKPFAALLGAFTAQNELRLGAIGGKDSMSGSFNEIDVPPTLVSFAVAPGKTGLAISPEFKSAGSDIHLITVPRDADHIPDFEKLKEIADLLYAINAEGKVLASHTLAEGGLALGLSKMTFGNKIGAEITTDQDLYCERYFHFIIETRAGEELPSALGAEKIGTTTAEASIKVAGETLLLEDLIAAWTGTLENTYPSKATVAHSELETFSYDAKPEAANINLGAAPKVIIPVFPGTNCEYDTARAFRQAGADAETFVFRNLTAAHVEESLTGLAEKISESQILMLPGGFSAGDEPDGSGKFIATVLRNPRVADAVMSLLKDRDGLALGICNGFQALVKTGLVPYGEIRDPQAGAPTLTFNDIGRHIACYATTRIASNKSPWLAGTEVGDLHNIAFSHGEGKFYASEEDVKALAANGQIATQYTDLTGTPSMDIAYNPNGSVYAIEGITSPDGRVLGKMGHTERRGNDIAKNIAGNKHQPLFKAGVSYFA